MLIRSELLSALWMTISPPEGFLFADCWRISVFGRFLAAPI
ncbi:hypothetical protein SynSYN20_03085 [Synechococcus sp. SYN20]|nr:hypothetical protein SynSYN20_03085 [Synechococcus sp. SYN20]